MLKRKAIATALGFALPAAFARAEPALDYSIGAYFQHSDNINYSETDPVAADVLAPVLNFSYRQQGSTLDAIATGSLEYRDYLGGPFGNELRTVLSGTANWHLSPGRLDWVFEDNASRQPINPLEPDAPSNNQQTNVFSTGPTLRAKFSDALRGQLDLRYTNSHAQKSEDFDSNRYSALGSLLYQLDPSDTISASGSASRVDYTDDASRPFDYRRQDAYVGYQHATRVLTLETAVGYSWLDLDAGGAQSGSLLRGTVRWTPTPDTSLAFNVGREYSDAAQDLVFTPNQISNVGIGSGISGAIVAPQVYVEKRAGLDFSHRQGSFLFSASPYWRKLDYVGAVADIGSDVTLRGGYGTITYYPRPTLWIDLFSGTERRSYTSLDRTDRDLSYGLTLNLQRTRNWVWSLMGRHQRRDSDTPGAGFSENSVILTLTYRR